MISRLRIAQIAILTPLWFVAVYILQSSLRPDFSHFTDAISELGSVEAPNRWLWNIFGYMLPGVGIALLGVGVARDLASERRGPTIAASFLVTAGLFMTLSGLFPGDFVNRSAPTMVMHAVGSFGSFVAFIVAGFWLPYYFRKQSQWNWVVWPSMVLVAGAIATGFLRSGHAPGLGQRLGFLCFFAWVGLVGIGLLRSARTSHAV